MAADIIAPWIIEAWHDAVLALSFDIPTFSLDPYQRYGALAATGMVLLAVAWSSVSHLPRSAKLVTRALLAVALLGPAGVLTAAHLEAIAALPKFAGRLRVPPAAPDVIIQTQRLPEATVLAETRSAAPQTAQPSPPAPVMQPSAQPPVSVASVEAERPPLPQQRLPVMPERATPTAAANATIRRLAANLTRLLPKPAQTDLMPIFYGTDRAVDGASAVLDYTAARADRLELGRAFIQIPRAHQQTQSERPWAEAKPQGGVATVGDGDLEHHFAVHSIAALPHDAFVQEAVQRLSGSKIYKDHALIFVPGFNTSFDTALYRAAQIAYDLQFDGVPFVYSWPSTGRIANYGYDKDSTASAHAHFGEFLRVVLSQSGAKTVSFIAHGLGAGLTLDALIAIKDQIPAGTSVRELILTAPDMDRAGFAQSVKALQGVVGRTTLYAASNDRALNISRRYTGGVPRAGDVLAGGPLVLPGVETVDVSRPGTDAVGLNHKTYVTQALLVSDIKARLSGREARDTQSAALESVASPEGPYLRLH